jgi:hypothetical protein
MPDRTIVLECDVTRLRRWYRRITGIRVKLGGEDVGDNFEVANTIINEFISQQGGKSIDLEIDEGEYGTASGAESIEVTLRPDSPEALELCRRMSNAFTRPDDDEIDFLADALPPEEDESHFTHQEKEFIKQSLASARDEIKRRYHPSPSQMSDIEQKIDYLTKKVEELGKFSWKRLFISVLVGIAADLFKTTIVPSTLLDAFKGLLTRFFEQLKMIKP